MSGYPRYSVPEDCPSRRLWCSVFLAEKSIPWCPGPLNLWYILTWQYLEIKSIGNIRIFFHNWFQMVSYLKNVQRHGMGNSDCAQGEVNVVTRPQPWVSWTHIALLKQRKQRLAGTARINRSLSGIELATFLTRSLLQSLPFALVVVMCLMLARLLLYLGFYVVRMWCVLVCLFFVRV